MLSTSPSTMISLGPAILLALLQTSGSDALMQARQDGGDSDSDSDSDSGSNSRSCSNGVCTIKSCQNHVCQTVISTRGGLVQTLGPGQASASGSVGLTPTPAPTGATGTHPNSGSISGTLSAHPSNISSTSSLGTDGSSGPRKGALAGIIIAILVAIGLLVMWLTRIRNRRRRRQKRPQGFVPAAFLTGTGITNRGNNDYNDMAQVESGSRSPVVGPIRTNGNVGGISYRNGPDSSRGGLASPGPAGPLSPLLPAITPGYEGRIPPNTARLASHGGDGASVLTSPYSESGHEVNYAEAPLPPLPREVSTSASSSTAWNNATRSVGASENGSPTNAGALYSDMRSSQKQLEADSEKQGTSGRISSEPVVDVPPSYSSSTR